MIRALFVTSFAFLYILIIGMPYLVYTLISHNTDPIYRAGVLGAKLTLRLAGITLDVRGRERIPMGRAAVFMANHQSNCDPPAIVTLLPPVLILVKQEFFRVPVLGRGMRLRGFVAVNRADRAQSIRAIGEAERRLQSGRSFLVFPEGTRSPDGRLLPFKKGVFRMALRAGAPIVPVSISGSRRIMPKGQMAIRPGVVRVTFHSPIETAGCSLADLPSLQLAMRRAVLAGLGPEEQPLDAVA